MQLSSFSKYYQDNPALYSIIKSLHNSDEFKRHLQLTSLYPVHHYPAESPSNDIHLKISLHSTLRLIRLLSPSSFPFHLINHFQTSQLEVEQICALSCFLHDIARYYRGDLHTISTLLQQSNCPQYQINLINIILTQLVQPDSQYFGETFLLAIAELLDVGTGRYGNFSAQESYILHSLRNIYQISLRPGQSKPVDIIIHSKIKDKYFSHEILGKFIQKHNFSEYFAIQQA